MIRLDNSIQTSRMYEINTTKTYVWLTQNRYTTNKFLISEPFTPESYTNSKFQHDHFKFTIFFISTHKTYKTMGYLQ